MFRIAYELIPEDRVAGLSLLGSVFAARGFRITMWFVAVIVSVFAIQAFQYSGIFVMFLGGPLWIGILIYAFIATIAAQIIARAIHPSWLLVPVIYLLGGFGLHAFSVAQARAQIQRVSRRNVRMATSLGKALTFDVKSSRDGSLSAANLVENYGIEDASLDDVRRLNGEKTVTSTHFRVADAATRSQIPDLIHSSSLDSVRRWPSLTKFSGGQCVISYTTPVTTANYVIQAENVRQRNS